ncbi:hypothetical protein GmHk_10G030629 [Glycine max]|nr:hypothetical protein GmHk_10G030629 [Glycine max]
MALLQFLSAAYLCFTGSDVIKWRSFYETHDHASKCHYSEVFDHAIRETLCCLGRLKYLSTPEEDEVYSVARLLGDLVAYRASGTGHMELLAALALLQSHGNSTESFEESMEAPEMQIREAEALHKFAEAAYTGPLLDVGRNPFTPILDGDNWWRGHAAAFLKYVNLPPEALIHGRVSQVKCEAAYFIVVLHQLQSVVIAIRGTETPEDLITDGLCKECTMSVDDLAGLINCNYIHSNIKKNVTSPFPHYGHSGIVEAARELFMQIEGNPEGPEFVTSIIFGNEFSSRLSTVRLRAAAITSLSQDPKADSAMIFKLAHRFLDVSKYQRNKSKAEDEPEYHSGAIQADLNHQIRRSHIEQEVQAIRRDLVTADYGEYMNPFGSEDCLNNGHEQCSLWSDTRARDHIIEIDSSEFPNPFAIDAHSNHDPVSQFIDTVPNSENPSADDPPELYLPGFVIHVVLEKKRPQTDLKTSWRMLEREKCYRAYIANRESFKDIIVSPSMFLDHLPWRCHDALQKILKAQTAKDQVTEPHII